MQKLYITYPQTKKYLLTKLRQEKDLTSIVMTLPEFKQNLLFNYNEQTLYYVVKNYHVTKEIAKIYLETLYHQPPKTNPKFQFLNQLKEELEQNNLLSFNPLFSTWLSNYEVNFYHLLNDDFINTIISKTQKITKVKQINIPNQDKEIAIFKAKDQKEEVICILCKIAEYLKKGIKPSQIYLANLNQDYQSQFLTYSKIFNIPINFNQNYLYHTKIAQDFLNHFNEDWQNILDDLQQNIHEEEEEKTYHTLINVCNQYLTFPKDEEFKKFFIETLKTTKINYEQQQDCIQTLSLMTEEIDKDAYIFLVGANVGNFPSLIKDNDFITKNDRIALNYMDITTNNQIIINETIKRIQMYNNIIITYKSEELNEEYYPAYLLANLKTKPIILEVNYQISNLYNKLTLATILDDYYEYHTDNCLLTKLLPTYPNISYGQYDNTFKPFKNKNENITLSYSVLDLYYHCPFRFYLNHILKLKDNNKKFLTNIGTYYHHILQASYEPNFNFQEEVEKEKLKFEPMTNKEQFFFQKLTNNLQKVLTIIKEQESHSTLKNTLCEVEFSNELNHNYTFKGFIDKMYYDEDKIVLIDYKTGNVHIDFSLINYGIGMQLPIYSYLLSKSQFKKYNLLGFYIEPVIPKVIKGDFKTKLSKLTQKEYLLNGYSLKDEKLLSAFDDTYQNSEVINNLKMTSKGFYQYSKVLTKEEINNLNQFVEQKINEAVEQIYHNNFPIEPKIIANKNIGCEFCPYAQICNKTPKDYLYLENKKLDLGGEKDELLSRTITSN